MSSAPFKSALPRSSRRLVEWMQRLNYGRFENLHVRGGCPSFDPPPRVVRETKFGGDNSPRPESRLGDFTLKREVCAFFDELRQIGDGVVDRIEVQRGLPFRLIMTESFE
jgi:hypothetical protein